MLALYLSHRGELVNYAGGIVGDRAQAEDLVQEAWLRFEAAAQARPLDEPVGYLYRIVRNLALDSRRRTLREGRVVEWQGESATGEIADESPSPEAEAVARAELGLLMAAMAELPERTRIALEMRRLGGCKLKDIAAHLGVSVSVAHDIIAEGIAHCRRRVRPPR
ncbi:putative RNA polymerase sigma factor FecI [compost metagenome]